MIDNGQAAMPAHSAVDNAQAPVTYMGESEMYVSATAFQLPSACFM